MLRDGGGKRPTVALLHSHFLWEEKRAVFRAGSCESRSEKRFFSAFARLGMDIRGLGQ